MKTYSGRRYKGGCRVWVNKDNRGDKELCPYNNIVNHSPTGFEWGYGGSGPAQLAFAILYDHYSENETRALTDYQNFKSKFVSRIKANVWKITTDEINQLDFPAEPSPLQTMLITQATKNIIKQDVIYYSFITPCCHKESKRYETVLDSNAYCWSCKIEFKIYLNLLDQILESIKK